MVKIGSYAYCVDTTGVILVKIFQAFGASYKKNVTLGDLVYVVVRAVNTKAHFLKDERVKFRFRKGSVHRAVVVHCREKYRRRNMTYIWFARNAVVLVNLKTKMPLTRRFKFGLPKEIADQYPVIGAFCKQIL